MSSIASQAIASFRKRSTLQANGEVHIATKFPRFRVPDVYDEYGMHWERAAYLAHQGEESIPEGWWVGRIPYVGDGPNEQHSLKCFCPNCLVAYPPHRASTLHAAFRDGTAAHKIDWKTMRFYPDGNVPKDEDTSSGPPDKVQVKRRGRGWRSTRQRKYHRFLRRRSSVRAVESLDARGTARARLQKSSARTMDRRTSGNSGNDPRGRLIQVRCPVRAKNVYVGVNEVRDQRADPQGFYQDMYRIAFRLPPTAWRGPSWLDPALAAAS